MYCQIHTHLCIRHGVQTILLHIVKDVVVMKFFPSIHPVIHPVQLKVFYDSPSSCATISFFLGTKTSRCRLHPGAVAQAIFGLSHGQLYVAISRVTSSANIKIFNSQGPDYRTVFYEFLKCGLYNTYNTFCLIQ
jgi:hypothetical protein